MIYSPAERTPAMSRSNKKSPRPTNAVFIAMMKRHGQTTTVMKDRRAPRGGTRNKQREYMAGDY